MKNLKKVLALGLSVCVVSSCFVGCKSNAGKQNDDKTKLIWYYYGEQGDENDEVFAAANKIISEKINATVEFQPISMGEYSQKMKLKASASEVFDLQYVNEGGYLDNVMKNGLLPLDELLDKYAPNTKKAIPEKIWQAATVKNKIYAVPNYQVSFLQPAYIFKKELVDKYNLKNQIDAVTKLEDLTPILETIKKNEPNIFPSNASPLSYLYRLQTINEFYDSPIRAIPVVVDKDLKVISTADGVTREEELSKQKLAREWNKKGFFHKDVGIAKNFDAEQKSGKFFMLIDVYKPGIEADMQQRYGYPVYAKTLGDPIISTSSVMATATALSRTSKNPEKAIEFLELLNTNKELYNTLIFGLEGKQYKKTGEDSIEVIPTATYKAYAWAMGCQFNAYKLPGQESNVWEKTKKLNEEALASPMLGFYMNLDTVKTQIANIQAASAEYSNTLSWGLVENYEELSNEMYSKMKDDIKVILDETQNQIEEFKSSK